MGAQSRKKRIEGIIVESPSGVQWVTIHRPGEVFEHLEGMITRERPRLIATARKVVKDPEIAEDIVQGSLLAAYLHFFKSPLCVIHMQSGQFWIRGAGKFHPKTIEEWLNGREDPTQVESITNLPAWLHAIVHKTALNYYRQLRRLQNFYATLQQLSLEGDRHFEDPESMLLRMERYAEIRMLVEALPPLYREVIRLRFFQMCSLREVADRLQRSLDTVKSQERRGLKLLKDALLKQREVKNWKLITRRPLQAS